MGKFLFSVVNIRNFCAAYARYLSRGSMQLVRGRIFITLRGLTVDRIHSFLKLSILQKLLLHFSLAAICAG